MSRTAAPNVLVFDVNETLLDIDSLEPLFIRLFGNKHVLAGKSRAKRIAVDRPIPWLAPVIIATELIMSPFSPRIG